MKNIYKNLLDELPEQGSGLKPGQQVVLSTLIRKRGSGPQVIGASALFNSTGLLHGTIGGGALEGDALLQAKKAIETGKPFIYDFAMDADISAEDGAVCGGTTTVMMDPAPEKDLAVFERMAESLGKGDPGVLATWIRGERGEEIDRRWLEVSGAENDELPEDPGISRNKIKEHIAACLENGTCINLPAGEKTILFLEPLQPIPRLVIAGAGHIGRALAHQANLLDFEVTVVDDREEFANPDNIPDADDFIVQPIGKAIEDIPKTRDTYIVIVTRGHKFDADALRACIRDDLPYIGLMGSRKKIRLMRENFISSGWATAEQFDRVHAPVGLEIGSTTVPEIAISISSQLVRERARAGKGNKRPLVSAIILAAGASSRMGEPKMLLPFREKTIIETVAGNATGSLADKTFLVLGAAHVEIARKIQDLPVVTVLNPEYQKGMLSSVQKGLDAVPPSTTAIMVLLGDQPMIGSEIMDGLIEKFNGSEKTIMVAGHEGKRGHPLIFDSKYIKEILGYTGEGSLRDLLTNHPEEIGIFETGSPEIFRDIDTKQDYQNETKTGNI